MKSVEDLDFIFVPDFKKFILNLRNGEKVLLPTEFAGQFKRKASSMGFYVRVLKSNGSICVMVFNPPRLKVATM